MCGRYYLAGDIDLTTFLDILSHRYDQATLDLWQKGDIVPSQLALTYCKEGLQLMKWNYRLFDRKIINSRIESIQEKSWYQDDYNNRKCLIVASGFYEFDQNKDRYMIHTDRPLFYMAGIYQPDEQFNNFSIITKPATITSDIHPRVPIVMDNGQATDWLNNKLTFQQLKNLPENLIVESRQKNMSLF